MRVVSVRLGLLKRWIREGEFEEAVGHIRRSAGDLVPFTLTICCTIGQGLNIRFELLFLRGFKREVVVLWAPLVGINNLRLFRKRRIGHGHLRIVLYTRHCLIARIAVIAWSQAIAHIAHVLEDMCALWLRLHLRE